MCLCTVHQPKYQLYNNCCQPYACITAAPLFARGISLVTPAFRWCYFGTRIGLLLGCLVALIPTSSFLQTHHRHLVNMLSISRLFRWQVWPTLCLFISSLTRSISSFLPLLGQPAATATAPDDVSYFGFTLFTKPSAKGGKGGSTVPRSSGG